MKGKILKIEKLNLKLFNSRLTKEDVTIGLQSTLRNLKNSKAHHLIVDNEISPRWFGKHLLAMTLSRNDQTKIFIVPNLKDLTKQIFGVPSVIFCINKEISALSQFYSKLEIHDELLKSYRQFQSNNNKSISKRKPKKLKPEVITPIVHLKRSENPAFIPAQHEEMEVDSSDFICLKKYEETSLLKKPSNFHSMRIKQVLPNPNRKQKNK